MSFGSFRSGSYSSHNQGTTLFFTSVIILASFTAVFFALNSIELVRPRMNVPVIGLPGESFNVEIETKYPILSSEGLAITIISDYNQYNLPIEEVLKYGNLVIANVSIPLGAKTDVLYDLKVEYGSLMDSQLHAVKVIAEYKSNFSIAALSDIHVNMEDFDEVTGEPIKANANFIETIIELNLIKPEFVIITGDLVEWGTPEEQTLAYEFLTALEVPFYLVIGNHEWQYSASFIKQWKLTDYSFNYGPDLFFIAFDTGANMNKITDQQVIWIENEMETHKDVKNIMCMFHAPPFDIGINRNFVQNRVEFFDLCGIYNVTACLFGHDHDDDVWDNHQQAIDVNQPFYRTRFIETRAGESNGAFRLLSFENGFLMNFTKAVSITERHDRDSLLAFNIEIDFGDTPNNGSVDFIGVNVTNKFAYESFTKVKLRIRILPNNPSSILVTGNATYTIINQYALSNPSIIDLELEFDLFANTSYWFNIDGR
jgi:predicted phosphohydrolase